MSAVTFIRTDLVAAAPVVTLPADVVGSNPVIQGQAEVGATVYVKVGSQVFSKVVVGQMDPRSSANGNWSLQLPLTPTVATLYDVTMWQIDAAGNTSSSITGEMRINPQLQSTTLLPPALTTPVWAGGQDTGSLDSDRISSVKTPVLSGTGAKSGATVQLLLNDVVVASTTAAADGSYSLRTTDYKARLPEGTLLMTIRQVVDGASSTATPLPDWTVDSVAYTVAPSLMFSGEYLRDSTGQLYYVNTSSPTFSGTTEAGAVVKLFDGNKLLDTVTADASGVWKSKVSDLGLGAHSLTTLVTDVAGNTSALSMALSIVRLDVPAAPTGSWLQGSDSGRSNSDGITQLTSHWLKGTVTVLADQSLPWIVVFDNGQELGRVQANALGDWTFNVKGLTDGGHALSVQALNAAGGWSPSVLLASVQVDTAGPDRLGAPVVSGDISGDMSKPTITGVGEANASVELYANGLYLGQTQATAAGNYTFALSTALTNGVQAITAVQVDAAGNRSAASFVTTITVSGSGTAGSPAATLSAPVLLADDDSGLVGDGISNKTSLRLTGKGAIGGAQIGVYNGAVLVGQSTADTNGEWQLALSGLTQGSYLLSARQIGGIYATSEASAALALTIDISAAAPTLALSSASRSSWFDAGYTTNLTPEFYGAAEAGALVQLYNGSKLLGSATASAKGVWSIASTPLAIGHYTNIRVRQTDVSGNVSPDGADFSVVVQAVTAVKQALYVGASGNVGGEFWGVNDRPGLLSMVDVDQNGTMDIFTAPGRSQPTNGGVGYLSNNGRAVLSVSNDVNIQYFDAGYMDGSYSVYLDLNGDGRVDAITPTDTNFSRDANAALNNEVWVNRGGPSRFANVTVASEAYTYGSPYKKGDVTSVGDFNGDGHLDYLLSYTVNPDYRIKLMLSTGEGIWRSVFDPPDILGVGSSGSDRLISDFDVNLDGISTATLDAGHTYKTVDINGDGYLDLAISDKRLNLNTTFLGNAKGEYLKTSSPALPVSDRPMVMGDVNGDGLMDGVYINSSGRFSVGIQSTLGWQDQALAMGWDSMGGLLNNIDLNETLPRFRLIDLNNDRSLDLVLLAGKAALITNPRIDNALFGVSLNTTLVAENTFLRVMVTNDHGGLDAYGARVMLFDSQTGMLARQAVVDGMLDAVVPAYGLDFFGLDPAKTYDVVVVYPGNTQRVTVLTGKVGLGLDIAAALGNIAPSALVQIVDTSLTAVSPGGKDVVWVAKEDRSSSETGGIWTGTSLADQLVGDRGHDVFKSNGAIVGEVGDTLTGGGGHDRFEFEQLVDLNTMATITDFSATKGSEADVLDIGKLLTATGYAGARTASGVISRVKLIDDSNGNSTTVQVDAFSGPSGASSGWTDLVKLKGVTGISLEQMVSGGFIQLGGPNIAGIKADQTVTETVAKSGVLLASTAALTAEGGQWASDFNGGVLSVKLAYATAEDTLGLLSSPTTGITLSGSGVLLSGVKVATIDSTHNCSRPSGQLDITFDFEAAPNLATQTLQADVVQTVMRSLTLSNSSSAPLTLDREVTINLTDGLGHDTQVLSGLRITPVADAITIAGVRYITGTEAVDNLLGTNANEVLIGYNGVPVKGNLAGLNTGQFGFGDTLTGGGGKDTFQWLAKQAMNSDATEKITDFGFKGGTGSGQGSTEADVLDLSKLLEGYSASSNLSDFVRVSVVNGKVQIQADIDRQANGKSFEKSWFLSLDGTGINANSEVLVNGGTMQATATGLSGNVTLDNFLQQMVFDQQLKVVV